MDDTSMPEHRPSGRSVKRTITLAGSQTSLRLTPEFWDALREVCRREAMTVSELIRCAERGRDGVSRTAAVRAYLIGYFRARGHLASTDPDGPPRL